MIDHNFYLATFFEVTTIAVNIKIPSNIEVCNYFTYHLSDQLLWQGVAFIILVNQSFAPDDESYGKQLMVHVITCSLIVILF